MADIDYLIREFIINWALIDVSDPKRLQALTHLSLPNWIDYLYCEELDLARKTVDYTILDEEKAHFFLERGYTCLLDKQGLHLAVVPRYLIVHLGEPLYLITENGILEQEKINWEIFDRFQKENGKMWYTSLPDFKTIPLMPTGRIGN